MDRYRDQIRDAARKHIGDRSISDQKDQEISIPGKGIDEPRFGHRSDSGEWDYVLPGNKDYLPGDSIDKPRKNGGGGRGNQGGKGQTGDDEFTFVISYDEYLDIIFDDLELPNLIKQSEKTIKAHKMRRAGFTTAGVPTNLNVERTAIAGLGRRLALKKPKSKRISELEAELEAEKNEDKIQELLQEIQELKRRLSLVSFLDRVDLRYNNFVPQPRPVTQAVMFCVMDVSYSMGEAEKIMAKKFFLLLHLFLKRQYEHIDVVFVRHHEEADECDEETFFTSRTSGGTVVSTGYAEVQRIINSRYPADDWNIYLAQASDGDNYGHDDKTAREVLGELMPLIQFMAYIEISRRQGDLFVFSETNLWAVINDVRQEHEQIAMQRVHREGDIVSVFRKFFSRRTA